MFKSKFFWMVIIFIAIGFALRLYTLLSSEFFRDEAFSTLVAQKDFAGIISTITTDSSVPFSYFVMHIFGEIFGYSTATMRLPSFIASIFSFFYFWKLIYLFDLKRTTRYFLMILFCINPPLVYYATEARFYGFFIAIFVYQLFLLASIWKNKKITTGEQVRFVISSLIGVYNHTLYWFVLFIWGLAAIVFIKKQYKTFGKQLIFKTAIPFLLILILFLPWVSILVNQFHSGGNGTWLQFNLYNTAFETINEFAFWPAWASYKNINLETIYPYILGSLTTILLIIGVAKSLSSKIYKSLSKYTVIFLITLISFFAISHITPIFYIRYLSFLIPIFLLLICIPIDSLSRNLKHLLMLVIIFLVGATYFVEILPGINSNITVTQVIQQIDTIQPKDNYLVLNKDALTYFNMEFYGKDSYTSYIYDPNLATPIWVGKSVIPSNRFISEITDNYDQIFVVTDSGIGPDLLAELDLKAYTETQKFDYSHNLQLFVFER